MPIQAVTNPSNAQRYMLTQLRGGTTLAKLVAERVDFSEGRFWFGLSHIVDQATVDFGSGNIKLTRHEGLFLAQLIRLFISQQGYAVFLQETQMKPSELKGFDLEKLAVLFGEEIYWRIATPEMSVLSDEEMLKIVHSASLYPFSAFFSTTAVPNRGTQLTLKDLEEIANSVLAVAVGAFDEGSFLIWWRESVRPFPLSSDSSG
jgi:hypothetical protein